MEAHRDCAVHCVYNQKEVVHGFVCLFTAIRVYRDEYGMNVKSDCITLLRNNVITYGFELGNCVVKRNVKTKQKLQ